MSASAPSPFVPPNWKFQSLKEILETDLPAEPPWRVKGLVCQGTGTQVSSQPHGCKSYSWLQAVMEASLGLPVWGHFACSGVKKTLFLETEDSEYMLHQRVQAIAHGLGIRSQDLTDATCCTVGNLGPFDLVRMSGELRRALDCYKPDFVVLSTLQGLLAGRDWTRQNEMADVNALLVQLSTEYCPLINITHSPLNTKLRRAAGTVTQAANFGNLVHYQKAELDSGTVLNINVDSKMGHHEKFKLRLMNGRPGYVKFAYEPVSKTADLRKYMDKNPEEPTESIASKFGVSSRYIRKMRSPGLVPHLVPPKSED